MTGQEREDPPDLLGVILECHALVEKHFPADVALKRFKTAIFWFAQNLKFGHYLSKEAGRAKDMHDVKMRITTCFESGIC